MNYKNENITKRAEESALWKDVETQQGNALPFLLERYLLLENWQYRNRLMEGVEHHTSIDDMQYVHLLLAEASTVLLAQEERIRKLESALMPPNDKLSD